MVPSEFFVWLGSVCASALSAAPSDAPLASSCCFNDARSAVFAAVVVERADVAAGHVAGLDVELA